ncbi:MAG: hypothetical protein JJU06_03400 [Ectothiorhodospiraceae bacterium]|nr:hypothetical protein [Ectothiorhodospiraceae bacterium]MCH8505563.1 hypothetical protein [Ectothiorhodospiraceae bacterium]
MHASCASTLPAVLAVLVMLATHPGDSLADLHDDEGVAGDCLERRISEQPNGLASVVACYLNPGNEGATAARWWIANDVLGEPYLSYVWVCSETIEVKRTRGEKERQCKRDREYTFSEDGNLIGYAERELLPVQRVLKRLRWEASEAPEEFQDYPHPPEVAATEP